MGDTKKINHLIFEHSSVRCITKTSKKIQTIVGTYIYACAKGGQQTASNIRLFKSKKKNYNLFYNTNEENQYLCLVC